jgi:hypothetical protein
MRLISTSLMACTWPNMWLSRPFSALRTMQCTTLLGTVMTMVSHTMLMYRFMSLANCCISCS